MNYVHRPYYFVNPYRLINPQRLLLEVHMLDFFLHLNYTKREVVRQKLRTLKVNGASVDFKFVVR
jgi:hypothetical protein